MRVSKAKKQVATVAANIWTKYKTLVYLIVAAIVVYGCVYLFTRQPQMPAEYKAAIDSLVKVNATLSQRQTQLDSAIAASEAKVNKVDFEIHNIKEKTTVIKEYYHEISQQVDHYDAAQVDSFFKLRYNY